MCVRHEPEETVHRSRVLLAVPVLLLGLAGCGENGSAASEGTPDRSNGSDGPVAEVAQAPEDLCALVTAAELSTALGVTVTIETGPSGDCEFDQEDPRALSGSIGVVDLSGNNGGYAAYLTGLDGSLTDPTEHAVPGLGGPAVLKVGLPAYGGSSNLMAGGAVDRGAYLLQVTLVQGTGMTEEDLVDAATGALALADGKVG